MIINSVSDKEKSIICAMPQTGTSEYVLKFAEVMEAKLDKNRHKGDREGWLKCDPWELLVRLKQEVKELELSLEFRQSSEAVLLEAADVANFAMMVADSYTQRNLK